MMNLATDDTIVAIATPPGQGGVGIVRLSGPLAWTIGQRMFTRAGHGLTKPRTHHLYFGHIQDPASGDTLDEGLVAFMQGPRTYTGEDTVEFNAHGAPVVLRRIVAAALGQGARAAEPGEMTLRAFLHGRIDLAQAEAVADLIAANSEAAARQALGQLAGELSTQIQGARGEIIRALAPIDASIDFPEEEVPLPMLIEIGARIDRASQTVAALLAGAERGRVVREGVRCAIAGRPNVGKSSLLNRLLRADRAIVTPIAGTTRDTIEETAIIGGIACHLIDMAGIATTADPIEQIGMDRSRAALAQAEIALLVLDASEPLTDGDRAALDALITAGFGAPDRPCAVVLNKADLPAHLLPLDVQAVLDVAFEADIRALPNMPIPVVATSLVTGAGVDELEAVITSMALGGPASESAGLVARARHRDALRAAAESLTQARITLTDRFPLDLVAEDLRDALNALGAITGETITEDLLSSIFAEFCIGK